MGSTFFLGIAFYFAATAICTIANFAWRQPMFDQYLQYATYLGLPFPQNIVQLDNGHRPIIPNLVRLAEIHWFGANQLLQITLGTLFACFTSCAIAFCAWRERALPLIARAIGVMLGVLGVLWLGNARMLLHGNESLHVYLVTVCVVCAALLAFRARHDSPLRWLSAASIASAVATFSFGPGIATFAEVIVLAILLRMPMRTLLVPAGAMSVCIFVYIFVLPGNEGVRRMLDFHPLESAGFSAQWISSPWVVGWLGAASPVAPWMPVDQMGWQGHVMATSANFLVSTTTLSWHSLATMLGLLGASGFCLRAWLVFRNGRELGRLETLALGIGFFALASAAVIGLVRLDYLREYPDQVFADRYVVWPSLFWASLALLILGDVTRQRAGTLRYVALVFVTLLPCMLYATHSTQSVWAEVVYRDAQRTAAALRSNVVDLAHFPGNGPTYRTRELATIDLLRGHHLAMFADLAWQQVGKRWTGTLDDQSEYTVVTEPIDAFNDSLDQTPSAHFEGRVTRGIATIQRTGQLAVLDEDQVVAGLAEFSFIAPAAEALRLNLPRKRGFDGYIGHYDASKTYTLVLLSPAESRAVVLANLSAGAR